MEATGQEVRPQVPLSLAFHILYQKCLLIQAGRACLETQPSVDPCELEANQFTHRVPGDSQSYITETSSQKKNKQVKCLSAEGITQQQNIDSSPQKKTLGIFSGEFYSAPKFSGSLV